MNARQERRLLLAALDFAEADRWCRISRTNPAFSRADALRKRRLAKHRLLTAAGEKRQQPEIDLRPAIRTR